MKNKDNYAPDPRSTEILKTALTIVRSVPYQVSARWVFYRLLQASFYQAKEDYKKWLSISARARHASFQGWRPNTLADETRQPIPRGKGWITGKGWIQAVADATCSLDKWLTQDNYVEIWYEARAMTDQFEHYSQNVTLRPMGGQPSIPYKYQAAQELARASRTYSKPITILYFGDLDPKGQEIAETVENDVAKWCDADFEFIHAGLTQAQVDKYEVPENFDHPGAFQWEALTDTAASEIIQDALKPLIDLKKMEEVEEKEREITAWLRDRLIDLAEKYEAETYGKDES